jgi:hypothetical protein
VVGEVLRRFRSKERAGSGEVVKLVLEPGKSMSQDLLVETRNALGDGAFGRGRHPRVAQVAVRGACSRVHLQAR